MVNSGSQSGSGIAARVSDPALAEHNKTLRAFADILGRIAQSELVRIDPYAQMIINAIASCNTPMEADELMDKLLVRVGELIAIHTGDHSELHHLTALTGARRRVPITMHAHRSVEDNAPPSRTFMKL